MLNRAAGRLDDHVRGLDELAAAQVGGRCVEGGEELSGRGLGPAVDAGDLHVEQAHVGGRTRINAASSTTIILAIPIPPRALYPLGRRCIQWLRRW